mgnify:CR=1 FL=1
MSDEATGKSGKTWRYAALALAVLPLLYWLSLGPTVVLAARHVIPEGALGNFYGPLNWVTHRVKFMNDLGGSYMELWLDMTNTPLP